MKKLQVTLFIIGSLILLTQTVRHVHLYFFELASKTSALDQFNSDYQIKKQVGEERSTKLLVEEYGSTRAKIKALEKDKTEDQIKEIKKSEETLYDKNTSLRREITDREDRLRDIRDIWVFSGAGLVFILLGSVFYLRQANWTGMSLLIAGFSEIIYWSSPSFFYGGARQEYELLLLNKITLSLIGLSLLYIAWHFRSRFEPKN